MVFRLMNYLSVLLPKYCDKHESTFSSYEKLSLKKEKMETGFDLAKGTTKVATKKKTFGSFNTIKF